MKYKARVVAGEYEFVEIESEDRDELVQEYFKIKGIFDDKVGHNQLEWARVRNTYAQKNEISIEDMEACNKAQRYFINEMKLVFKSIKE